MHPSVWILYDLSCFVMLSSPSLPLSHLSAQPGDWFTPTHGDRQAKVLNCSSYLFRETTTVVHTSFQPSLAVLTVIAITLQSTFYFPGLFQSRYDNPSRLNEIYLPVHWPCSDASITNSCDQNRTIPRAVDDFVCFGHPLTMQAR
ncbi:uncharacterized protein EV420DRAFT_1582566 [Desarmillaria tabescens]|uniref:Uncharacterized protein n=1 Tax=Armillaria tabescens TaxID=1929756 RepID=A0AA39MNC5_ARMTA|nr:uncharacterized protein EV420DRAFT_1582566 [Desarmillaria tabescens]KAK0440044.1 hypothetical protein EV420DRAFT_1582566 [Desarmillaria tabescens]